MPRRRDTRVRVKGPSKHPKGWKVTTVDPEGNGGRGDSRDRYFAALEDAEAYKRLKEEHLARLASVTISAALEEYQLHLELKGTKAVSYTETMRRLKLFLPDHTLHLARVTPEMAAGYYDTFRVGRSVDYHRNTLAETKTFFCWCTVQKWMKESPLAEVRGVGARNAGKPQLTGDEARKLYSWCLWRAHRGDEAAAGVLMLLTMALRQADVTKRLVRDLDLDGTVLRVTGSKTKKGDRPRHIPGFLQPILRKAAEGRGPLEPLFKAESGGHHTKSWLRAAMRRFCKAAGVPYVPPHGLKGTAGTLATEAGLEAERVAEYLSHESRTTTEKHYVAAGTAAEAQQSRALSVLQGGKR